MKMFEIFSSVFVVKYYGSYFKNTDLWVCQRFFIAYDLFYNFSAFTISFRELKRKLPPNGTLIS